MTAEEFNTKYADHIEEGFYGLEFDIPEVTAYMDTEFEKHVHNDPKFEFAQIKLKFGMARVYTNMPSSADLERKWEENINKIVRTHDELQNRNY